MREKQRTSAVRGAAKDPDFDKRPGPASAPLPCSASLGFLAPGVAGRGNSKTVKKLLKKMYGDKGEKFILSMIF